MLLTVNAGSGIILLQMSKVDPSKLQKEHNLDRKSMLLLKVANEEIDKPHNQDETTAEIVREEEPGVDVCQHMLPIVIIGDITETRDLYRLFVASMAWQALSLGIVDVKRSSMTANPFDLFTSLVSGGSHRCLSGRLEEVLRPLAVHFQAPPNRRMVTYILQMVTYNLQERGSADQTLLRRWAGGSRMVIYNRLRLRNQVIAL